MSWVQRLFGSTALAAPPERREPRVSYQDAGGGMVIRTSQDLEEALREGTLSASGEAVTPNSAMKVAAVYACVRIRAGVAANMPLELMKRVGDKRLPADDHPVWRILKRRPNRWQTPSQFKRMMTAHVMLRGNAYGHVVRSIGKVKEVLPLHPDRTEVKQLDDLSLEYTYTRRNGTRVTFKQSEIFHLVGLTLDGVHGVSPITYARETIGAALAMEQHGSNVFRNGAQIGTVFKMPATGGSLSGPAYDRLKASLDDYRNGGDKAGGTLLLEEGLDVDSMTMSAADAQFIENKRLTRTDIAMFFGVPPHMIGDTEKSTSFGTGIESQTQGFVSFTSEDDLTMWEETIGRDLLDEKDDAAIYARFNRSALVRGDIKARWDAYTKALQWGVSSPNEIRAFEDQNPRDGGDVYYPPPNTAGSKDPAEKDSNNEPAPAT